MTAGRAAGGAGVDRHRLVTAAPLLGALALVAATLLTVFVGGRARSEASQMHSTIAREQLLTFADRNDGAVVVTGEPGGRVLAVITGQNGFLRGTLSGLARIRRIEGIGRAAPFKLTEYTDQRLTLSDPATGKIVELEAFGPTNEGVFAQFMRN